MPAPDKYPDWATDDTNNVEPPDAKKAAGWVPSEEPPSSWFNWWENLVGLWVRWLEAVTNTLSGRIDDNDADIGTLQTDLDTLEAATAALATDAARKSEQNTFVKSQIFNTELNWADDPLLSTTAKPGDDPTDLSSIPLPPGSNRWKLVFKVPTQGIAWASIWVGQSPWGAALVNNARWHIGTQRWRQLDPAYVSTALVGRSGQWITSYVPAGAAAWADWPSDNGGDFIAGGNVAAHFEFVYHGPHTHLNQPLRMASGAGALVLNADGTYSCTSGWAEWALRIPAGVTLSNIEVWVNQSTASSLQVALVRRGLGTGSAMPTYTDVPGCTENSPGSGFRFITIFSDGHVVDGDYEYSIVFRPAVAGDKIGRIAVIDWDDPGPRNIG